LKRETSSSEFETALRPVALCYKFEFAQIASLQTSSFTVFLKQVEEQYNLQSRIRFNGQFPFLATFFEKPSQD